MRSEQLAQRILSLVVPSERAAAIVGDLVEAASSRGPAWFWTSLARVVTASLCQDVLRAPLRFVGWAAISWFAYMFVTLPLMALGVVASALLWVVANVLSNHTGVELLTDWLQIQMDWGPAPGLMRAVEFVMVAITAPFVTGRIAAHWWPHRELAAAIVMSLSWPLMATMVPWVGYHVKSTTDVAPVMMSCLFLGTVWIRLRQPSQPA